jgi:hypothetical protein
MTDHPNSIAIVIPLYEGDRTRQLVSQIPPEYRDHIITVGAPAPLPGATNLPGGGSWAAGCRAALAHLEANKSLWSVDVVCTLDGRCNPAQINRLIAPLMNGNGALILGSRRMRKQPAGTFSLPTLARNWLSCRVIQLATGKVYTDITPFRAMTYDAFQKLAPTSLAASQFRAPRCKLKTIEVPVDYGH